MFFKFAIFFGLGLKCKTTDFTFGIGLKQLGETMNFFLNQALNLLKLIIFHILKKETSQLFFS